MLHAEIGQKEGEGCRAGCDEAFSRAYLKIRRGDIAYMRFVLESYDGVGFIRTVDASAAIVEFNYPPSQAEPATGLLGALRQELSLEEVDCPGSVRPL